jgi:tetratricopeptide (TPR) repeat protein
MSSHGGEGHEQCRILNMTQSLFDQGISAAQTGRRDEARTLLAQAVEADERNEQAWLWLAGLVDDPQDMRTCLHNVLHLNPDNVKAQQGLAWVEQRHGKRSEAEAAPAVSAPPLPDPAQVLALTGLPQPNNPCPYCGAATREAAKRCSSCLQNLMERVEGRETRSKALTALGWLWGIGGVFSLLGAALLFFVLMSLQRNGSFSGIRMADLTRAGVNVGYAQGRVLGGVLWGVIQLAIARGLLRRKRWAWIASTAIQALQLLGALCVVIFFAVGIRLALSALPGGNVRSGSPLVTVIFTLLLLIMFAPQILSLVLIFFSYGDIFAPMKRLAPRVGVGSPIEHYNHGLDYKNRGMWYMAAQEWATAVSHAPHQPDFLHALGLAFVQLKQFDRARATLDFALQVVPGNAQIADSRALVDRMEKGGWW